MKHSLVRCLTVLLCLAWSLSIGGAALAESYVQVVLPQYDEAREFSEGLAAVLIDGKWGYIAIPE